MTNLFLLSQKLATKLKNTVFLDQFRTVPSTFRLSLPKIMGQVPISFVANLDKPKFRFHSLCQSKVMEEKPLGGGGSSPSHLVPEFEGLNNFFKKA